MSELNPENHTNLPFGLRHNCHQTLQSLTFHFPFHLQKDLRKEERCKYADIRCCVWTEKNDSLDTYFVTLLWKPVLNLNHLCFCEAFVKLHVNYQVIFCALSIHHNFHQKVSGRKGKLGPVTKSGRAFTYTQVESGFNWYYRLKMIHVDNWIMVQRAQKSTLFLSHQNPFVNIALEDSVKWNSHKIRSLSCLHGNTNNAAKIVWVDELQLNIQRPLETVWGLSLFQQKYSSRGRKKNNCSFPD